MGNKGWYVMKNFIKHVLKNVINSFPNKPWFMCLLYKSFENTVGKGEIACREQFLFFPQCFVPFLRTFCHIQQIQNYRIQIVSFWNSLNFVV